MSNTTEIALTQIVWTDCTSAASSGFITNEGLNDIIFVENDSLPATTDAIGHTLKVKDFISFELAVGQDIYCRSSSGPGKIAVTTS